MTMKNSTLNNPNVDRDQVQQSKGHDFADKSIHDRGAPGDTSNVKPNRPDTETARTGTRSDTAGATERGSGSVGRTGTSQQH